jgi:hypothetical protein
MSSSKSGARSMELSPEKLDGSQTLGGGRDSRYVREELARRSSSNDVTRMVEPGRSEGLAQAKLRSPRFRLTDPALEETI